MNEYTYESKVPFFLAKLLRIRFKELENIQTTISNMKMNAIL